MLARADLYSLLSVKRICHTEVLKKRLVPPSSKLTDSLTTSTCGSWFGSTTVTPGTPADADLCSPKFDPAACDQETLLKHTAGRHGQASSSSLRFGWALCKTVLISVCRGCCAV